MTRRVTVTDDRSARFDMGFLRLPLLLLGIGMGLYLVVAVLVFLGQRSFLYFPTRLPSFGQLSPWMENGRLLGFAREVPRPSAVWLMAHGNGGQAAHREYVLPRLPADAALFVVEYPGYGLRPGKTTAESMNAAVHEAYQKLLARYPGMKIGLIGESIGSGPVCALARETPAPRKIVLIVPFDTLLSVAAEHMRWLPVSLMLRDRWDNCTALKGFAGPVDVYGARLDTIIPAEHARKLATAVGARFTLIEGGHNDWSMQPAVKIE